MNDCQRILHPLLFAAVIVVLLIAPAQLAPADEQRDLVALEEQAMRAAVERVAPAVVRIETIGGKAKVGDVLIGTGPTTGVVVDPQGYIISSAFNFVQEPSSILVTLPGGERQPAEIVARDESRLLVLLKVESEEALPVAEAAPLDSVRVGQWAIAVGRTFPGEQPNLSVGIVSALDRMFGRAIQTDAKISPNNYGGPLVDIHGRILGVLVPMSPQGGSEVAGVEWYDGGIGFAVPWEAILQRLPDLKTGKDLQAGLLGITLAPGDPYAEPATVATVAPNSPAYEAGLRAGDRIIEVEGQPIATQMQLKIQLGRYYAGDKLQMVVLRDEKRLPHEVELVAKLPPVEHAFLGLLPMRGPKEADAPAGITIRYVFPDSPAAKADMQPGDRVTKIGEQEVGSYAEAIKALSTAQPGSEVTVEVARGDQSRQVELIAASLPTAIPGELPPAHEKLEPPTEKLPAVGTSEVRLPEFKNPYQLYVPENYHPRLRYGLLVWLHGPGSEEEQQTFDRWKALCKLQDLILVAPGSNAPNQWERTEADYIARVLADVQTRYAIDPARVVVHGYQAGGAMAYLVGLQDRETIAAVAAVDAPLPARIELPENDPLRRLAVFSAQSDTSRFADRIEQGIAALQQAAYPVTEFDLGREVRYLKPEELVDLARWIDALDRF